MSKTEFIKMQIAGYKDEMFEQRIGYYDVLINPSSFSHKLSTIYANREIKGNPSSNQTTSVYKEIQPETVFFILTFDGTGIISLGQSVTTEIEKLKQIVYTYNGSAHSPNYVLLRWGSFQFKGRLTSLNIDYKMFKPDGYPLRATATLTFESFVDSKTLALQKADESADLSHVYQVRAGDTLPLLCARIYGNSAYYLQVAHVNKLVHFRWLKPGSTLIFPPLV